MRKYLGNLLNYLNNKNKDYFIKINNLINDDFIYIDTLEMKSLIKPELFDFENIDIGLIGVEKDD